MRVKNADRPERSTLGTVATLLAALVALGMMGRASPGMAVAWLLLANAAVLLLVADLPRGDDDERDPDDWSNL